MAQIPDFTAVGTQVPTPAYRRPFFDRSGEIIAQAGEGLGRSLEEVGNEDYVRSVNLARAQASNALLDHEIAVKDTVENIRTKVASGDLSWDQAGQAYQDGISQLKAPQVPNLDQIGQDNLDKGMKRLQIGGAQQVLGIARAGQKQAFSDQYGAAMDKLGKLAGMPDADIESINQQIDSYRPMALAAGIKAEDFDKSAQAFKDRNWLNQATQRSMEAKDDMGALRTLQHDLTDADGYYAGKLDTEKRNVVLRSVINDQLILQNRAEHEQDKREAKALGAMNRVNEQIASGIPLTPAMWDQAEQITRGTSVEDDFKEAEANETRVQEVLRQPIADQLKYVQDQEARLETDGGSLRDRANLLRLRTAVGQNVNLMQNNPLIFAANRNGTEVQPIDFSQASSAEGKGQIADAITDRMSTISALRKQYGPQIGVQPLLPQEVATLHSQLDSATPPERAHLLTSLRDAFNNDDAYQAVMRRIAPGSPVTAIAGQMTGTASPAATPAWFDRQYAPQNVDIERVLRGEALLNPASAGKEAAAEQEKGKGAIKGGMPMPQESQLHLAFGNQARGLFEDRPQLADAYYSVFKSAYAALLAEKGDMRGVGDSAVERQALKIALGNKVDFNGGSLSVPAGMDPTRFAGLARTAVTQAAQSMKASEKYMDGLSGYQLRELGGLGSGTYELVHGNMPVVRPDGNGPFIIDLHKQFLPGMPGAAANSNAPGTAALDPDNKVAMAAALEQQRPQ